jgi:Winged helix-turn helix
VLACAEGGTNKQAAVGLGADESAVDYWRTRFIAERLEDLADEPRPGRWGNPHRTPKSDKDDGGGIRHRYDLATCGSCVMLL